MTAQQVWQSETTETLNLTPAEIRERLERIRRRMQRSAILVYILGGLFLALVALRVDSGPGVTTGAIESVRFVLAAGIVLGYERLRQLGRAYVRSERPLSIAGPRASARTIDAYRDELRDQLEYLQSASRFFVPLYFAGLPLLAASFREQPAPLLAAYLGLLAIALVRVVWQTRKERPWVRGEVSRISRIRTAL